MSSASAVLRAVAEHGTFKDAAEALSYSQPRISQQIAALEREAGTTLVERGPQGRAPHRCRPRARRALRGDPRARGRRRGRARGDRRPARRARAARDVPDRGGDARPARDRDVRQAPPAVELSLVEGEPEDALPRLKEGELDVAMVFEYDGCPRHLRAQLRRPRAQAPARGPDLRRAAAGPPARRPRGGAARGPRDRVVAGALRRDVRRDAPRNVPRGRLRAAHRLHEEDYNVVQGLVAAGVAISLLPSWRSPTSATTSDQADLAEHAQPARDGRDAGRRLPRARYGRDARHPRRGRRAVRAGAAAPTLAAS